VPGWASDVIVSSWTPCNTNYRSKPA